MSHYITTLSNFYGRNLRYLVLFAHIIVLELLYITLARAYFGRHYVLPYVRLDVRVFDLSWNPFCCYQKTFVTPGMGIVNLFVSLNCL